MKQYLLTVDEDDITIDHTEVPEGARVLTREQVEAAMYRLGRDQYAQLQQGLDDLFGKEGVNNANSAE